MAAASFTPATISASETAIAAPWLSRRPRRIRKSPSALGTRRPWAWVVAFSQSGASSRALLKRLHDRRAALGLDRVHPRPLRADEAHRLHLREGLPHADEAGAAAGRVEDRVGQRPVELLRDLVAHRLLALDAVGLLERRALVPAVLLRLGGADAAGVRDQPVDHLDVRAVGLGLHHEQLRDVARQEDVGLEAGGARRRRRARCRRCPPRAGRRRSRRAPWPSTPPSTARAP